MQEPKAIALPGDTRLRALAETPNAPFISGLPVSELLLARDAGFNPIAQVTGSCIWRVWKQYPSASGEMKVLTEAHKQARILALSRMQQEARMLKAHGVVSVRMNRRPHNWSKKLLSSSAMGTAVRIPGQPPPEYPFLSDLSGQDVWALKNAGFYPVGLVFGNCVWHEAASIATMQAAGLGNQYSFGGNPSSLNQELGDFTQAVYQARRHSMTRLQDECSSMKASGVLGIVIEKEFKYLHTYSLGLIVSFQALGTAIAQMEDHGKMPGLDYRLQLSDPPTSEQIFLDL